MYRNLQLEKHKLDRVKSLWTNRMAIAQDLRIKLSSFWAKTALALVITLVLSITVFFNTWRSMVDIWYNSNSYNHDFVIAPISLWLCWTQRRSFLGVRPTVSWLALGAVFAAGLLWLIADLASVQVIAHFSVVAMLIGGLWAILGNRIALKLWFPMGYLFFMVPAGEELVSPLMEFTATFAVAMIRLTGIPVFREGLNFSLPSGNWSVVEACSGINYLIASVSLGFVYAYLTFTKVWKRLLFMALSMTVPVIANGLRAYMIVMIGHFSSMTLAVGVDHLIYGALFFGLVMMLLFYVSSFWRDPPEEYPALEDTLQPQTAIESYFANRLTLLTICMITVLYTAWPLGSENLFRLAPIVMDSKLENQVVTQGQDWQPIPDPRWAWVPDFHGASIQKVHFSDGRTKFGIYQLNFENESQGGAELVSSQNALLRHEQRDNWTIVHAENARLADKDGEVFVAEEKVISGGDKSLVLLRWYQIGRNRTSDPYQAKLLQLFKRLSRNTAPEVQVILVAEAPRGDFKQAEKDLKNVAEVWLY
jgi:exosortase A